MEGSYERKQKRRNEQKTRLARREQIAPHRGHASTKSYAQNQRSEGISSQSSND